MVLYRYDFLDELGNESPLLSRRGHIQLEQIAERSLSYSAPIIIESTGLEELDERRREHVIGELAERGVALGADLVVVRTVPFGGLQGVEANIIHGNMLQQTRSRGSSGGGSQVGNISGGFGAGLNTGFSGRGRGR